MDHLRNDKVENSYNYKMDAEIDGVVSTVAS